MRRTLEIITALVTLAWSLWEMTPHHEQQRLKMGMARGVQTRSEQLARFLGQLAMRDELAGQVDDARAGYQAAYRIMTGVRERAEGWYENLRENV
jgi:hypothetical protein